MTPLRQLALRGELHPDALLTRDELLEALPGGEDVLGGWLASVPAASANLPGPVFRWGAVQDLIAHGRPRPLVDPDDRDWLSIAEAADALSVSERHIRNLLRDGTLTRAAIKCGRLWRIHRERLFEALEPHQEVNHGMAQGTQAQESRDGKDRSLLLDPLAGPARDLPGARSRVHGAAGGEPAAEGLRGPARDGGPDRPLGRRGRAAAFTALLDAAKAP